MMHRQAAHIRIGILGDQLPLKHVRILNDLRNIVDRADGHFPLFEEPDVVGLGALADKTTNDRIELLTMRYPQRVGAIARVVNEFATADRSEQPLSHFLGRRRQAYPQAVACPVGIARPRIRRAAADALLDLAGEAEICGLRAKHCEQRVEKRQVDYLTGAAVCLDLAQCDHYRSGSVQSGHAVSQVHRWKNGFAVGETVHRGEPGHALDQRAKTRPVLVGTALAPAGNTHDHELGIGLEQAFRGKSHFLQRARTKTLDKYRRCRKEVQQKRFRRRVSEFEAQAFLAARVDLPVGRNALGVPCPQRVASRRFDLDDFRAKIPKELREGVAGNQPRQVEHTHAVERTFCVGCEIELPG